MTPIRSTDRAMIDRAMIGDCNRAGSSMRTPIRRSDWGRRPDKGRYSVQHMTAPHANMQGGAAEEKGQGRGGGGFPE